MTTATGPIDGDPIKTWRKYRVRKEMFQLDMIKLGVVFFFLLVFLLFLLEVLLLLGVLFLLGVLL